MRWTNRRAHRGDARQGEVLEYGFVRLERRAPGHTALFVDRKHFTPGHVQGQAAAETPTAT